MTELIIIIIIVPCSPTIAVYVAELKTWYEGDSSSVLMAMASRPPVRKKPIMPTRYWMPTTLWSSEYRKYRARPEDASRASSAACTGRPPSAAAGR